MNNEFNAVPHVRAYIMLNGDKEILDFIYKIGTCEDKFYIEDFTTKRRVDAESYLGIRYASAEFKGMFLVNETTDGFFPDFINKYRIDSSKER